MEKVVKSRRNVDRGSHRGVGRRGLEKLQGTDLHIPQGGYSFENSEVKGGSIRPVPYVLSS